MKISSKSILSPSHTRDAPISLSTSLSRRLKTNRSLKGAQSPMFPTGGKKRFENPEPSSPKVTCIGQVRVKTKKQGKKIRTLSSIRGNEVSFRRVEQIREVGNPNQTQNFQAKSQRNQRWVHIPLTICEALRGIGADFSCLFPCRSSCSSTGTEREIERERERKLTESREGSGGGSCAAVFARWLVAGREIELVVGGEGERVGSGERSLRRHVGEEIEVRDEECEVIRVGVGEEEEGRVSICVPPKNALLLMRCKSDPMRVSALVNRFWESPDRRGEEDEDEDEDEEDDLDEEAHGNVEGEVLKPHEEVEVSEKLSSSEGTDEYNPEAEMHLVMEVEEAEEKKNPEEELDLNEELQEEEKEKQELVAQEVEAEEIEVSCSLSEAEIDPEGLEIETIAMKLIQVRVEEEEDGEERRKSYQSSSLVSVHSDSEEADRSTEEKETHETILKEVFESEETHNGGESMESEEREIEVKKKNQERDGSESEETQKEGMESEEREREINEKVEREIEVKKNQERERGSVLPDCLLLMMCEPKLSMEVSKETWVCSTDFIRWLPERKPVKKINGGDLRKKRSSVDSNPLPPRSSCSLPAVAPAVSMAAMIEQKLVNAAAYEPFVLTRCKSEPMRTAAAKLAPETCFWKNRKLEPHRRATFGFGAAGVGF